MPHPYKTGILDVVGMLTDAYMSAYMESRVL